MLLLFFSGSALAAPLHLDVTATLPTAPSEMTLYETVEIDPADALQDFAIWFDFTRPLPLLDPLDDSVHARDGARFLWSYPDGGIQYDDTGHLSSERPIRPRSTTELWTKADRILDDLGLFDASVITLDRGRVGASVAEAFDAQGNSLGRQLTGQSVSYRYLLDGWTVFGPGGETTVEFDDVGLVSLSDAQRTLAPVDTVTPDAPEVAIARWLDRAEQEDRWTEYLSWVPAIEAVRLTSVRLGYFAPPTGAQCDVLEPVYEFRGVVLGHDARGKAVSVDFLWWEPAVDGRGIPSLNLPFTSQE